MLALLRREQRAGAAEAGGDLVADQQHVVRAARRAQRGDAFGGSRAACPPAPCTSGSTMTAASSAACSATIAIATSKQPGSPKSGARSTGKRSGSNTSVPNPPSPTESAPIVSPWYAPPNARNVVWPRSTLVGPVLERDLQRLLHRGRAVGRVEEVRVVDGHHARERLGQLDHGAVAVAEHRGVRAELELLAQRVVELGDAVARAC